MKAIVVNEFGPPEVMGLDEVNEPAPTATEVLVRVHAIGVNPVETYIRGGKYPAGGGWVMVKARRDPASILAALAAGRFYASTGVTLSHAERAGDELVVEVEPDAQHRHTITFIENGKTVATANGPRARRLVPRSGYIRAVVTRDDGRQAWVQPVRW